MFELFRDPKIDFLGKTKLWVTISIILTMLSIAVLAVRGIKLGIEFTGGTEVQIKYAARPDVGVIRSQLSSAGFDNHIVTTIGKPEDNEVYIRVALTSQKEESELTTRVKAALKPAEERTKEANGLLDLNIASAEQFEAKLAAITGVSSDTAKALAAEIVQARKERAILSSTQELSTIAGMTPEITKALESQSFPGTFAVRSQSYIGPVIGKELVSKAVWAILLSLAGMLVYIGFRFEFQWGAAAVIALIHDTIVSLGMFSLFGFEMTLPVVAAFLTLVGYSCNDTVVVFDRVRENMTLKTGLDLRTLINKSMNQTLSRTVLTSSLTWLVCISLFLLGGPALRDFAFVLAVGIIIGTYSSIYIAAPLLVLWRNFVSRRAASAPATASPSGTPKKVKASRG